MAHPYMCVLGRVAQVSGLLPNSLRSPWSSADFFPKSGDVEVKGPGSRVHQVPVELPCPSLLRLSTCAAFKARKSEDSQQILGPKVLRYWEVEEALNWRCVACAELGNSAACQA